MGNKGTGGHHPESPTVLPGRRHYWVDHWKDIDLASASPDPDTEAVDTAEALSSSQRARGFKLGGEQEEKES